MYKIEDLQKKSRKELLELVSELKGKLLALRFENSTGQLNETHLFQTTKKDIARIFTVINAIDNGKTITTKQKPTSTKSKTKEESTPVEKPKVEEVEKTTKPESVEKNDN